MDSEDSMVVHENSVFIDRTIGEAVGARVERAVGFKVTAVVKLGSVALLDRELDPRLVEIAHFRNQ
jgi:hypothetical protein